jgi:hypothetical protein
MGQHLNDVNKLVTKAQSWTLLQATLHSTARKK